MSNDLPTSFQDNTGQIDSFVITPTSTNNSNETLWSLNSRGSLTRSIPIYSINIDFTKSQPPVFNFKSPMTGYIQFNDDDPINVQAGTGKSQVMTFSYKQSEKLLILTIARQKSELSKPPIAYSFTVNLTGINTAPILKCSIDGKDQCGAGQIITSTRRRGSDTIIYYCVPEDPKAKIRFPSDTCTRKCKIRNFTKFSILTHTNRYYYCCKFFKERVTPNGNYECVKKTEDPDIKRES